MLAFALLRYHCGSHLLLCCTVNDYAALLNGTWFTTYAPHAIHFAGEDLESEAHNTGCVRPEGMILSACICSKWGLVLQIVPENFRGMFWKFWNDFPSLTPNAFINKATSEIQCWSLQELICTKQMTDLMVPTDQGFGRDCNYCQSWLQASQCSDGARDDLQLCISSVCNVRSPSLPWFCSSWCFFLSGSQAKLYTHDKLGKRP